jgi:UDP:flavonoid glycosyltransferase YjiC (YdhE family)
VVHHGGAGTTSSAARAGAPQILVPHLLDQFYFARRVRELGVGVATGARRGLDFAALAECIDAVLDNEILAERASALGERMRARDPHGAAAARLLSTTR